MRRTWASSVVVMVVAGLTALGALPARASSGSAASGDSGRTHGSLVVQTDKGALRGVRSGRADSFLGVRYAAPRRVAALEPAAAGAPMARGAGGRPLRQPLPGAGQHDGRPATTGWMWATDYLAPALASRALTRTTITAANTAWSFRPTSYAGPN